MYAVINATGQVACKGWATFGQAFVEAYGPGFKWRTPDANGRAPDDVLTWETRDGAQKFADMNGGTVTTITEGPPASA